MDIAQHETRLDEAVCLAMYTATNATVQLYRELLAPWGLTYQQLMVLGVLWQEPDVTPGRIAEVMMLDSSTVAGLLKRLQDAELVRREPDPADRRRVQVIPTERSWQIAGELGWLEACLAEAVGLPREQAADLIDRLHRLRESVVKYPRPQTGPHTEIGRSS
ncbi:MAG: MarR family transcriptional regulator [Scrofimicrobium sp.]